MARFSPERRNFIAVCKKKPSHLFRLLANLWLLVPHYLLNRLKFFRPSSYFIKGSNEISLNQGNNQLDLNILPPIDLLPGKVKDLAVITLAGEAVSCRPGIEWDRAVEDMESGFALHRFGWLLSALLASPSRQLAVQASEWLQDWIRCMGKQRGHYAWESYSVAERLANWPFILQIIAKMAPLPAGFLITMEKSMTEHLKFLKKNIEYRDKRTNNHLLNNARGLYIGGLVFNDSEAVSQAKAIFLEWTEKLFHGDGMLKEHSSHYQQLLCQRYEQVYFLARHVGDAGFEQFMGAWLNRMAEAADFFAVSRPGGLGDLPRLGDISPDFPPRWFGPHDPGGWPAWKRRLGWRRSETETDARNGVLQRRQGDFFRYDTDEVTIFWHINPEGYSNDHGHNDAGGFVIFYRGIEIFADPGRYSYSPWGSYGRYARAHNTLLIDSLAPYCEDHLMNSLKAYRSRGPRYHVSRDGHCYVLEIEVDGFSRLKTPVKWTRKFVAGKKRLLVADDLSSAGSNCVEARFQIAPGIQVVPEEKGKYSLYSGSQPVMTLMALNYPGAANLVRGGRGDSGEGWCSREYGKRVPGATIIFQHRLSHQAAHEYEIRWL